MDAFQLNNEDIFGPSWREGRTLLLVNLPFHKTRAEIETIVDTTVTEFAGGKLERVHWSSDLEYRAPKHTGKLYIVVSDTKTAKAAAAYLDGSNWEGRCLKAVFSYRYVFERDVLGIFEESMAAELDTQRLLSYHDTATPMLDQQSPVFDTLDDQASLDDQVFLPDFATLDGEMSLSESPRLVTVPFPQTPSAVPTFVAMAELFVENNRLRMRSSLQKQYISQLKRKADELEERLRKSEAAEGGL